MNENQNEMTSEQLGEAISYIRMFCTPGKRADQLITQVESLARQGLQLGERVNKAKILLEEQDHFVKGLEQTISALTAERDDLVIRLAEHKLELGKLDCELEALRKDKERLDKLLAGHKFRAEHHLGYWGHEHQYKQLKSREELDSAMEKDKSV